jgi:transcriptional regulator with XRE-family HTH domain
MRTPSPIKTMIRETRKARGFTLKSLAHVAGTTPQTIQRLETGNMTVSLEWLHRLAKAMDIQPYELLPHPDAEATPERLFLKCLGDAVIYSRRHVPMLDDAPLMMLEAVGKMAGLMLECRKGLRPWDDAYAQALVVAAAAMRVAIDGEEMRAEKPGPKLVEDAA